MSDDQKLGSFALIQRFGAGRRDQSMSRACGNCPLAGILTAQTSTDPVMLENSVLFISADPTAAVKIEAILRDGGEVPFDWHPVEALLDGIRAIQERSFDLILADLFLPDSPGLPTLQNLQQHAPVTPVIALVHSADRDTAVTAVRKGAYDFFCHEDIDPANLQKSFAGALRHAGLEAEKRVAKERRTNMRFPCTLNLTYQTLEHPILSGQGTSETLDISSKGILFTGSELLQAGQLVQVSLDWPTQLENQVRLKLVAEGRIIRSENGQTAMTIKKYEFRTRRGTAKPPALALDPAQVLRKQSVIFVGPERLPNVMVVPR